MHLSSQISSSTITLKDSITNAPISNSPPITLLNETHQHPHRASRHRRYRSCNRSSNRLLLNIPLKTLLPHRHHLPRKSRAQNPVCKAVTIQAQLHKVAQIYAEDMAAKNYYSHDGKDGSSPPIVKAISLSTWVKRSPKARRLRAQRLRRG